MSEETRNNITPVDESKVASTESTAVRPHHRLRPIKEHTRIDVVRQWLNIIFMVGAVAGVIVYFAADNIIGTYIILGAMIFKIVECIIRFVH